ncbi:MAG: BrnT family toxin [Chitinivibrionia bacterium]|nr:BrnT family toxin [Chitinivibrionia bacterium]
MLDGYFFEEDIYEWDQNKNLDNIKKHGISFEEAKEAFYDKNRCVYIDIKHSYVEQRFYCIGMCKNDILTVRFTLRGSKIRIIGAGFWRKERGMYETKNNLY